MKLRVRNFGPIRKADADLKPLTVFAGPSNTGKSYLAVLLYACAKTLGGGHRSLVYKVFSYFNEARCAADGKSWSALVNDNKRFPSVVAGAMPVFAREFRNAWISEAKRCFGAEWENIARQNGKLPCSVSVHGNGVALDLFAPKNDKLPGKTQVANHVKMEMPKTHLDSNSFFAENGERIPDGGDMWVCAAGFANFFRHALRGESGLWGVHCLPASRGGIMQSHHTLTSMVVEKAPEMGFAGSHLIPFTGVVADFLQKLMLIGNPRASVIHFKDLKAIGENGYLPLKMEKDILSGEIVVKVSETGYPDFRYRFKEAGKRAQDIPLMSASSAVSELAPIVLFMRHYLFPGDIFIVEEPEAHLHPAAQREVAEVLLGLVKAGVRVVVTTHSEVILGQLSNFIHADDYPDAKVLGKKSRGRTINKNKTAMYSFDGTRTGTVVRGILFDDETGMLPRDHLDVESDLLNEYARILDRKGNA